MKKNTQHSQHTGSFHERPLVTAVRHALPYVVGLSLALSISQPASSRSSDSAAAFTATQLVRQFTLKNTVTQVSLGMQGYVADVNGQQRGPAMGVRPTGFPADMGSVPGNVNLPQRDGAGRPLGYCAWDNNSSVTTAGYNAGQGVGNPLVYAIVSPGLNGAMQTTCADILVNGVGLGDDHVQVTAPIQVSSKQYKTAVGTFTDLQTTPGEEGDIRLVLDTNKLYSYVGGAWTGVQASPFSDNSAVNGTGAISYTGGTVTVADFQATTVAVTGAVSGASAVFTGDVAAATFTGNGAGLTDLNAANFSSGVISPEFGGTGVNGAAAANGTLLIGNGSGFTLGTLTAGAGISVLNDAGAITIGNNGVLSITGTADQIVASASNGDVVLSLPQAIAVTSTPTFGGMMLNGNLVGTTATFTGAVGVGSLVAQRLDISTSAGGVINPNMIVGTGAMAGAQTGSGRNTALGISALAANTSGNSNVAAGYEALAANTTGIRNTAIGTYAMDSNTTGESNVAIGYSTLSAAPNSFYNIAIGHRTMNGGDVGNSNIAVGNQAMIFSRNGASANIAIGLFSLYSGDGSDNAVVGYASMAEANLAYRNSGIGSSVLEKTRNGYNNSAVGYRSLITNLDGFNNSALGANADVVTGNLSYATAIGADSRVSTSNTIAIGRTTDFTVIGATGAASSGILQNKSLQVTGSVGISGNLAIGGDFAATTFSGTSATFTGAVTADRINVSTSAGGVTYRNMIVGTGAMAGAQSGFGANTALGVNALAANTTGAYNVAVGSAALQANTNGFYNSALGTNSLYNNTSGDHNTAIGHAALYSNTTGYLNTATGFAALGDTTTGVQNTALGHSAGQTNTTGSNNLFLGFDADATSAALGYATAIGAGSRVATSNTIALGRNSALDQIVIGTDTRNDTTANTKLYVNGDTRLNGALYGTTATFSGAVAMGSLIAERIDVSTSAGGVSTPNMIVGAGAMPLAQSGIGANTALGISALAANTTGRRNTASGYQALMANTTGFENTANGHRALYSNTNGERNTAVGYGASEDTPDGYGNVAVGWWSQKNGSIGTYYNTSIGYKSMQSADGFENVGIGNEVMLFGGGNRNVAIGSYSMYSNDGDENTTLGWAALAGAENADFNVALGTDSLASTYNGYKNVGVGYESMETNYNGFNNSGLGANADVVSGNLSYATVIGSDARVATSNTIALGRNSNLDQIVIGTDTRNDTFAGTKLYVNGVTNLNGDLRGTTATFSGAVTMNSLAVQRLDVSTNEGGVFYSNMIVGTGAIAGAQSGSGGNTAVGISALAANTTGARNTASGFQALNTNTIGFNNTASGFLSLYSNTSGRDNSAYGRVSMYSNTSGSYNTALGSQALYSNTTGSRNTAVGGTMYYNTTGYDNTATGKTALYYNTTGFRNTALGDRSGITNTTGSNNTFIGYFANATSGALTYATAIGSSSRVATNNTVALGRNSITDQIVIGTDARNDTYAGTKLYVNGISNFNGAMYGTTATFSGAVTVGSLAAARLDVSTSAGGVAEPNMIAGAGAMPLAQSGFGANTALGINALAANTSGGSNIANGIYSLYSNTTGNTNTASGSNSMYSNTTGDGNTASGYSSLYYNTTGRGNTTSGWGSLSGNTTGNDNTALGRLTGTSNTTGSNNTFIGYYADATSGALTYAAAIGAESLVATSNTIALGRNSNIDQIVIGTDTRNNTTANTKLYVNGDTRLNGMLYGTNATFSGAVTMNSLAVQRLDVSTSAGGVTNPNMIVGTGAMPLAQTGFGGNTAVGIGALAANTSGHTNAANGIYSLYSNTIGSGNVASGSSALYYNTTGSFNVASGSNALNRNTTGVYNVGSGTFALYYNTTGSGNVASGGSALYRNTTGINNVAAGYNAMYSNTTGDRNTALGPGALNNNTTGARNTAVGYLTLPGNVTGSDLTALGNGADVTVGGLTYAAAIGAGSRVATSNTIALGRNSNIDQIVIGTDTRNDTTANTKLYVNGDTRLNGMLYGTNATFSGAVAMNSLAVQRLDVSTSAGGVLYPNMIVGTGAMPLAQTGFGGNTALGISALAVNTGGNRNTATGYQALDSNTTGGGNTAIGYGNLGANTTGFYNVAIGYSSLGATASNNNIAIGYRVMTNASVGDDNIAMGADTMLFSENGASRNVAIGPYSMYSGDGSDNAVMGYYALGDALLGYQNSGIGSNVLGNTENGYNNSAVGYSALAANVNGSNNSALGANADVVSGNLSYATIIGSDARVATSNTIALGRISNVDQVVIGTDTRNDTTANTKLYVNGDTRLNGMLYGTNATFSGAVTMNSLAVQRLDVSSAGGVFLPNVIVGTGAMPLAQSGFGANTAAGIDALAANTSGYSNVASGFRSLYSNTTGGDNVASGYRALYYNTTGVENTAIGSEAMGRNTTGLLNVAVGSDALYQNTTGNYNVATGMAALFQNTTGSNNTATGLSAGDANTTGSNNTFLGYEADATSGALNYATAIGASSRVATSNTIALGRNSNVDQIVIGTDTRNDTTANTKLYVNGDTRLNGALYGTTAVFTGAVSMGAFAVERLDVSTSAGGVTNPNMIVGTGAMAGAQSGTGGNTVLGIQALPVNTSGNYNSVVGYRALYSNTSGTRNAVLGSSALYNNTNGYSNTAIGNLAMYSNTTGHRNVGIGEQVLYSNTTGVWNVAVGEHALYSNTIGGGNVGLGNRAIESNTTGFDNIAVGMETMLGNTTGNRNIALGYLAFRFNSTGSDNVAIGQNALNGNTTGSFNTALGNDSNVTSGALSYATAIGAGSRVATSNTIALGRNSAIDQIVIGTDTRNDTTANTKLYVNGDTRLNGALYGTNAVFTGAVSMGAFAVERLDIATSAGGVLNDNVIIGMGAMVGAQSGTGGNTAVGMGSMASNTNGFYNTATGNFSLFSNTTGYKNTVAGDGVMYNNTTGYSNTAMGDAALLFNTIGYQNTAIGDAAMYANVSGNRNAVNGAGALSANTTGSNNIALGYYSGNSNTTGSNNTFLGNEANATTGALTYATAIGSNSLVATSNTIALGRNSTADQIVIGTDTRNDTTANTKLYVNGATRLNGDVNITGALTVNGSPVGTASKTGIDNALTFGTGNLTLGTNSLQVNSGGARNTAIGQSSLTGGINLSGTDNTALGFAALQSLSNGNGFNVAIGAYALNAGPNINRNIAIGYEASRFNASNDNVAIGSGAARNNTGGSRNLAIGTQASFFNGSQNDVVAIGYQAAYGDINFTAGNIVALGNYALQNLSSGSNSVAIGNEALRATTSGTNNVALGRNAGDANTTGSNNLFLGDLADATTGALNYAAAIGAGSTVATSNTITLGRNSNLDQIVIGTATRNDTTANTKLYVNGDTRLNGTLYGTTANFSGAVTFNGGIAATRLDLSAPAGVTVPNLIIGAGAMVGAQSGDGANTAIGINALASNTTGISNTAIGSGALRSNTTGLNNMAAGRNALFANTSGANNAAYGSFALRENTIGFDNAAFGFEALRNNTLGRSNTGMGYASLYTNTTGSFNQAIGVSSLRGNIDGNDNVAVGDSALFTNVSGDQNTAIGKSALFNNLGDNNVGIGQNALVATTTGNSNTGIGSLALTTNTTGGHNTAIGRYADVMINNLNYATAIGAFSRVSSSDTVVLGTLSGSKSGGGADDQVVIGASSRNDTYPNTKLYVNGVTNLNGALYANTLFTNGVEVKALTKPNIDAALTFASQSTVTAAPNLALGTNALGGTFKSGGNVAIGDGVLSQLDGTNPNQGERNTGVGRRALYANTTGYNNTALGFDALYSNTTAFQNVAVGTYAMDSNTTGSYNTAVGYRALEANIDGYDNTAVGWGAMGDNTTGFDNTAVGDGAMGENTTGSDNVAMGEQAMLNNTTGSDNTALGSYTQYMSGNLQFATAIGSFSSIATSNTVVLGRASSTDQVVIGTDSRTGSHKLYVSGTALVTGGVTTSSDARLKTNIQQLDNDSMLEKLGQISAYRYNYINTPQAGKKVGVIAQELQTLFPEVANYGNGDQFLSVDYSALGAMAAVGVGQLNTKFKALDKKVDEQGKLITALDEKVTGVDTRVASLETWKTDAVGRMDGFQVAIDSNIKKIAENALAIQSNTKDIQRLDDVLVQLDGTVKGNTESINNINTRWGRNFSASEDGSLLVINATELKVSNFTAQQMRSNSVYTQRLEAEMAAIRELEVDSLKANTAVANSVQAKQVNTGAAQVYAGVGAPAFLFAAPSDGHYTVNTSAMDGSYATATVIVNAGQAKVVTIASEGIELMAVGNSVKANAAGKSIKASWIKTG